MVAWGWFGVGLGGLGLGWWVQGRFRLRVGLGEVEGWFRRV